MATLLRKDLKSDTWLKVKAVLAEREGVLLTRLRGDHDPVVTAKIRGRLAEITELLALDAAPGKPSTASEDAADPFQRTEERAID